MKGPRRYVDVRCSDCDKQWAKRKDSLPVWTGRCHSCAAKALAAQPRIKEIHRQNGLAYVAKYGKPCGPRMENRRRGPTHWHWRKSVTGSAAGNWRGGVTPEHARIRHSLAYRLWREAVFVRDGYTCVACGDARGGNLNADHIKPFSLYPDLRLDVSNGRTLCRPCHKRVGWSPAKARRAA